MKRPRATKVSTCKSPKKILRAKSKSKRDISIQNAQSKKSDRISSVILTSMDDDNDYIGLLDNIGGSTPHDSSRNEGESLPRDGASGSYSILLTPPEDADPSCSSGFFSFSQFSETPRRRNDGNLLHFWPQCSVTR